MADSLKTRHIFIDTSIVFNKNFQFFHPPFENLIALAKSNEIFIHSTKITIDEIKSKLVDQAKDSFNAFESFKKKARILKNLSNDFFDQLSIDNSKDIQAKLLEIFEKYLKESKINIITTNNVPVDPIFEKYFKCQPPFGPGKKKSEFPDAFVLSALELWCKNNKELIYCISQDEDMVSGVEGIDSILPLKSIEQFLDLFNKHEQKELSDFANDLLEEHINEVENEIKKNFDGLGFLLSGQDGEVEDVEVKELSTESFYLTEVKESEATFNILADLTFKAFVSFNDFDTAVFEGGVPVLFLHRIEGYIERKVEIEVEVEIYFDINDPNSFQLNSIVFDSDIYIEIDEDKDHGLERV